MADSDSYAKQLHKLQIELVKLQRQIITAGERLLVIVEGRDAAGKDGTIKHLTEHLSPRETRVVALPAPTERDRHSWYFQRYVEHLPAAGEMVIFNRSWYNRAGVEPVMGFCTKAETRAFLDAAPRFEHMLVRDGVRLFKYYLDITKHEQRQRLRRRARDPLTQWKMSPVDAKAQKYWDAYSAARNIMLARTHSEYAPWTIISADDKHEARLNLIRDLLSRTEYLGGAKKLLRPDPAIIHAYDKRLVEAGILAA